MKKWVYNEQYIISNITKVAEQATTKDLAEAKDWYSKANRYAYEMSVEFDISHIKCCALVSVLSPQKEWWHNLQLTRDFLKSGGTECKHYTNQVEKARTIYNSEGYYFEMDNIIKGKKTVNFFHNIHMPTSPDWVTLDGHMLQVCTGRMEIKSVTDKQYDFLAEIVKKESKRYNLIPSEFQSLLWLTWKRIKPRYNELKQ